MKRVLLILATALALTGCGYNDFQRLDEQTKSAWAEVLNQYQRRADLIPNIVATVKGETNFEQETLTRVVEARAKATSIQATPDLVNHPEAFQKFQAAQGELSGALSRLLVVSENYPTLKADQSFRDLQAQLEGTENRITVARGRYISTVQDYNTYVRQLPQSITAKVIGMQPKPNFSVANEAQVPTAPSVNFDTGGNNQNQNQSQNYNQKQQPKYNNMNPSNSNTNNPNANSANTVNNPYNNAGSNSSNNSNAN